MENRRDVKVSHSASCDQWRNGNIQHRTKMGELHNLGVGQIAGGRATASRLAAQPTSNPPLTRVVRLGFPAVALPSPMSSLQFVMHPSQSNLSFNLRQLDHKFLIRNVRFEGLQHIETCQYPIPALREMLLNALVHCSYLGVHTQIRVWDGLIVARL